MESLTVALRLGDPTNSAIFGLIGGVPLVIASFAVLIVYRGYALPPFGATKRERWRWLAHGAWVSFLSQGVNAAGWSAKWALQLAGNNEAAMTMGLYGGFIDPLMKWPGVWAAIAHLTAAGVFIRYREYRRGRVS